MFALGYNIVGGEISCDFTLRRLSDLLSQNGGETGE